MTLSHTILISITVIALILFGLFLANRWIDGKLEGLLGEVKRENLVRKTICLIAEDRSYG